MGHHIDSKGRFQSDKYPDLASDKIISSFKDPSARRALLTYAEASKDKELVAEIRTRFGDFTSP